MSSSKRWSSAASLLAIGLGLYFFQPSPQAEASLEPVSSPELEPELPHEAKKTPQAEVAVKAPPALNTEQDRPEKEGVPSAEIEGWVSSSTGETVAGAQVGASSDEGAVFTSTDEEGRFIFTDLPSEKMNIFATAKGRAPDHAHGVPVGTQDLLLIVDQPASLKGSVSATSLPHLFVRLCKHSAAFDKELCIKSKYSSPPEESYEMRSLPSGNFELVFVSEEVELQRIALELRPGQETIAPPVEL